MPHLEAHKDMTSEESKTPADLYRSLSKGKARFVVGLAQKAEAFNAHGPGTLQKSCRFPNLCHCYVHPHILVGFLVALHLKHAVAG